MVNLKVIGGCMRVLKFALMLIGTFMAIVAAGWIVITFWWVFAIIVSVVVTNYLMK